MTQIRLCRCGAPPVQGPWCDACARERQKHREPLGLIDWGAADID